MKKIYKERIYPILQKYFSEFALIFISVILAFALTEWSNNASDKKSANTILSEIKNGLISDHKDFSANVENHKLSINGVKYFRNWLNGKLINQDSLNIYYFTLFRNYTPIINKTGYESLKSNGLKTIENDSIRFKIIDLYEHQYKILETLEITNNEMQDFNNYFKPTNQIISKNFNFDTKGNIISISNSSSLSAVEKKEMLSYLWRMQLNKNFKIIRYNQVINKIKDLETQITSAIKNDR